MNETIYVKLLEEGLSVWRPVTALKLKDGTFQILASPINEIPNGEKWEFQPGDVVEASMTTIIDGTFMVAQKKRNRKNYLSYMLVVVFVFATSSFFKHCVSSKIEPLFILANPEKPSE